MKLTESKERKLTVSYFIVVGVIVLSEFLFIPRVSWVDLSVECVNQVTGIATPIVIRGEDRGYVYGDDHFIGIISINDDRVKAEVDYRFIKDTETTFVNSEGKSNVINQQNRFHSFQITGDGFVLQYPHIQ